MIQFLIYKSIYANTNEEKQDTHTYIYYFFIYLFFLNGKMLTCIHFFLIVLFLVFGMSDHIFVLSHQNGDLAGHMSFQKKKIEIICRLDNEDEVSSFSLSSPLSD